MPPSFDTAAQARPGGPPAVYLTVGRTPHEWAQYLEAAPVLSKSTGEVVPSGSAVFRNGAVVLAPEPPRYFAAEDASTATALREYFAKQHGRSGKAGGGSAAASGSDVAAAAAAAAAAEGELPPEWTELEAAVRALSEMPRTERFASSRMGDTGAGGPGSIGDLIDRFCRNQRQCLRDAAEIRAAWAEFAEERRLWDGGNKPPGDGSIVLGDADVVVELKTANTMLRAAEKAAKAEIEASEARTRAAEERIAVMEAALKAAGVGLPAKDTAKLAAATADADTVGSAAVAAVAPTAMPAVTPAAVPTGLIGVEGF